MTIDTLEYAEELEAAGVSPQRVADIKRDIVRIDGRLNLLTWMLNITSPRP